MSSTAPPAITSGHFAQVAPDLRIVRLADATHWLVHEQPQRIIREISEFVADGA